MPNISKRRLEKEQLEKLFSHWYTHVAGLDIEGTEQFFSALLGPEEQIMLAKRFAAIVMLMQGRSGYKIWNDLDLSPSTVENIKEKYKAGQYDSIRIEMEKRGIGVLDILETIDSILHLGGILPRYNYIPKRKNQNDTL